MLTWPNLRNGDVGPEVGDRQPLVVGEAPAPRSGPSDEPLVGRSSRWLAWLMRTSYEDLRARARFINLLPAYPGRRFPVGAGRAAVRSLVERGKRARAALARILGGA